jgi:hypothetical protein
VEVKDNSGNVVEIMRDNNIEERSHRWSRMHILFSNLESETYVNEILPDMKDFIRELQDIT